MSGTSSLGTIGDPHSEQSPEMRESLSRIDAVLQRLDIEKPLQSWHREFTAAEKLFEDFHARRMKLAELQAKKRNKAREQNEAKQKGKAKKSEKREDGTGRDGEPRFPSLVDWQTHFGTRRDVEQDPIPVPAVARMVKRGLHYEKIAFASGEAAVGVLLPVDLVSKLYRPTYRDDYKPEDCKEPPAPIPVSLDRDGKLSDEEQIVLATAVRDVGCRPRGPMNPWGFTYDTDSRSLGHEFAAIMAYVGAECSLSGLSAIEGLLDDILRRGLDKDQEHHTPWEPPLGYVGAKAICRLDRFTKKGSNISRSTLQRWMEYDPPEDRVVYAPDNNEAFFPESWVRRKIGEWSPRPRETA